MKRRSRDARRLMNHQRTLIRTSCPSKQDIFEAFAVWRQRKYWNGGHYQSVQCLNIYNVEQVGKRFSQITKK